MIWIKKIKLQSSDTRALILSTEMMKKFSIKRNKPKPSLSVISRLLFHQQQTLRTPPPLSSSFLAPDSSSLFSFLFCNFFSFSSLLHHPPLFDPPPSSFSSFHSSPSLSLSSSCISLSLLSSLNISIPISPSSTLLPSFPRLPSFFHHPPLLTFFFISSTLIFLVKFTHPSFYIPSFSLYFNFVIPGLPSFPLPLLRSEAFCRFCMFMNVFIYVLWWLLNHPGVYLAQVRPWKVSCGPCSSWLFLSERE